MPLELEKVPNESSKIEALESPTSHVLVVRRKITGENNN